MAFALIVICLICVLAMYFLAKWIIGWNVRVIDGNPG